MVARRTFLLFTCFSIHVKKCFVEIFCYEMSLLNDVRILPHTAVLEVSSMSAATPYEQ